MNTLKQANPPSPHQVLDPCLLGRPVHLLPTFASHFRDDLAALFLDMNRRYKAAFEVGEVTLARIESPPDAARWITYRAATGQIAFSLERHVLLCVLDYRYGDGGQGDAAHAAQTPRVTTTEERLAVSLGRQLVQMLAARIAAADGAPTRPHEFTVAAGAIPHKSAWTVSVALREANSAMQGKLWFSLDEAWLAQLLQNLASLRDKRSRQIAHTQSLAPRLHLTLTAHLTSKEIPLEDLLDVRVGDVIPVSLGRADVLLDDSRLFTATVAENLGKLCLTSFEDVE